MCNRCIRGRAGKGNGEKGGAVGDAEGSAGPAPVKGDWKRKKFNSRWCSSVDWLQACEPKSCWFDS